MSDSTSLTLTIRTADLTAYAEIADTANITTDNRDGTTELEFEQWNQPRSHEFHVTGVPFFGRHGRGESYLPAIIYGDGLDTGSLPCTEHGELYVVLDRHHPLDQRVPLDPEHASAIAHYRHCISLVEGTLLPENFLLRSREGSGCCDAEVSVPEGLLRHAGRNYAGTGIRLAVAEFYQGEDYLLSLDEAVPDERDQLLTDGWPPRFIDFLISLHQEEGADYVRITA